MPTLHSPPASIFPLHFNPPDNVTWPVKKASVRKMHWIKKPHSTGSVWVLITQIAHQLHCYSLSSDKLKKKMLRLLSIMQLSQKFSHKYGWGSWLLYSSHSQELRAAGSEAVWGPGEHAVLGVRRQVLYQLCYNVGDLDYYPLASLRFRFFIGKNWDILFIFQA